MPGPEEPQHGIAELRGGLARYTAHREVAIQSSPPSDWHSEMLACITPNP
jgi:hypothetical protein